MDTGVTLSMVAAVIVVGVVLVLARRWDQRHHQKKLELIQERIRRRQESPVEEVSEERE